MAATAEYLAEHPFADPDIVNPPEAPTYRYRPDINSVDDLALLETDNLSAGSRIDIIIDSQLVSYVLQAGIPTGSELEVVPEDYDVTLNQQYWLLVAQGFTGTIPVGEINFADIGGTLSVDQLPPGSLGTLDSIGEDALYFLNNSTGLPELISASETVDFLSTSLTFANVGGTISIDQFPAGSVVTVDTIDADALYFFDNSLTIPRLITAADAKTFLSVTFDDIGGTISLEQFPDGSVVTIDSIDEDGFYFFDNTLFTPELIGKDDALAFLLPDQTGNDGKVLQTNAGVLSWTSAAGGSGAWGGITGTLSAQTDLQAALDAKQPLDSDLTTIAGLTATTDNFIVSVSSAWSSRTPSQVRTTLGLVIGTNVQAHDADLDAVAALTTDSFGLALLEKTSAANVRSYIGAGTSSFDGVFASLTSKPTTLSGYGITDAQPLDSDLTTIAGLTATTDNFIVSVSSAWASRTPSQVRTTLGLVIGTDVQAHDGDLDTIAGLTATTDNFIVSVSSAWSSRTPSQVRTTLGLVIGTNVQAWDADLDTWAGKTPYAGTLTITTGKTLDVQNNLTLTATDGSTLAIGGGGTLGSAAYTSSGAYQPIDSDLTTIAGLTATTDNFIVSVASAWASRTPAQVLATLAAVGTTFQPLDSDLTTIAGLTATTDNFIVSVSSAWASRTPSQVRTTLGLVIGTNVQAWDADLDTLAGLTATTDNFIVSVSSAWSSRTPSQVRTTLGLVIGTNVQAWDADLDTWAGVTPAANMATFIATPSSANLRATMTDEIGTGACVFDGATLSLLLTTATCGSSLASLNIPAGTVPTTPNDGDIFADANCLYACTDVGNAGVIPICHIIRADSTVTQANDANAHAIFTTPANGRLTLETGTYFFKGLLSYGSMSGTSGNIMIDILGAGTATIGAWLWTGKGIDGAPNSTGAITGHAAITTNTSAASICTAGVNQNLHVEIYGSFEVTGVGTIIPTQTLVTAAQAVLAVGSHLMFWRVGSTSMTSVGQWD